MRTRRLWGLLLLSCALVFALPTRADSEVGQQAPAYVATTFDGKNFDLSSLQGKVVVIHFWATWCAACRDEMPALEAVWRRYRDKGLEVMAISADRPRAKAEAVMLMHYFTFPASMMDSASKNDFGTPVALPITYVIGKDGMIADIMRPDLKPLNEGSLGDEVKNLLDVKIDAPKSDVKPHEDAKPHEKTEGQE